jgi:predicted RNA-binding protein (virulence factor B family)
MMNEIAVLRVVALERVGAFLNFNNDEKDLFLPYGEQTKELEIGEEVLVFIYEDQQARPISSMKVDKFLKADPTELKIEQKVDLIVYDKTDLGYKALINKKYIGILYKNEVFKPLQYLENCVGYVKKIRDDKKIDLILQPFGNKGADDLGLRIIEVLEDNNGFLAITDKTEPDAIYKLFQVSKKKFKMALGGIYKKRLVTVDEKGIHLVK